MSFPFQVSFGPAGNNPTLLPNLDTPLVTNGVVQLTPSSGIDAAAAGTASTGSVTVAGTVASGNVITVTVANPVLPNGAVAVSYTATGTDTLATVAANLAVAMNNTSTLSQYGWSFGSNGLGELILSQRGPVGNFSTISASTTGAETFTIVQMSGGTGTIVPLTNFTFSHSSDLTNYWYGKPVQVGYGALSAIVSQGLPVA